MKVFFFHDFNFVYSLRARANNLWENFVSSAQEAFITMIIVVFFSKIPLNIIFSHDFMHTYSHGAEADNLGGQV